MADVKAIMQSLAGPDFEFVTAYNGDVSGNGKIIQDGSLGYEIDWSETLPNFSGYRSVFFEPQLSVMRTILSVSLSEHLEGGARVAPVAQALLAFGARLATTLSADAVVWNPGKLLSQPAFFVDSVESYVNGGVFPVLVAVDFEYSDDECRLRSTGLSWFSGQEIELSGANLRGQDLTRRGVRLVHDIAVNGPVMAPQKVPDIDDTLQIDLIPLMGPSNLLQCDVLSKLDTKAEALTLH